MGREGSERDLPLALLVAAVVISTVSDMTFWTPGLNIRGLNAGLWACAMLLVSAAAFAERTSDRGQAARRRTPHRRGYSLLPFSLATIVLLVRFAAVPSIGSPASRCSRWGCWS